MEEINSQNNNDLNLQIIHLNQEVEEQKQAIYELQEKQDKLLVLLRQVIAAQPDDQINMIENYYQRVEMNRHLNILDIIPLAAQWSGISYNTHDIRERHENSCPILSDDDDVDDDVEDDVEDNAYNGDNHIGGYSYNNNDTEDEEEVCLWCGKDTDRHTDEELDKCLEAVSTIQLRWDGYQANGGPLPKNICKWCGKLEHTHSCTDKEECFQNLKDFERRGGLWDTRREKLQRERKREEEKEGLEQEEEEEEEVCLWCGKDTDRHTDEELDKCENDYSADWLAAHQPGPKKA